MSRINWRGFLLLVILGALAPVSRSTALSGREYSVAGGKAITSAETDDSATLLDNAFLAMYDLNFSKADSELAQFTVKQPEDPMGPAAQAVSLLFSIFEQHQVLRMQFFVSDDHFMKRKKINPDPVLRSRLENSLIQAEQLAMRALEHDASDKNALLVLTLVYGLRADHAALVEHHDLAALRFSNKGNEWAHKLLSVSPQSYDAYVATGIQKYLVSLKPAPVRWMLRIGGINGNRDEGLRELELAADKGHYLAPFAQILLAIAFLRKGERQRSIEILRELNRQFPHNSLFAEEVARLTLKDPAHSPDSISPIESPGRASN
jgi:hypothetical protein